MIILDVRLDNFCAFKNFHVNLTYPKKIVDSSIKNEHLLGHPNFRYKKVNIIMGANASGKTTFGHMLKVIFNFIEKKNSSFITDSIASAAKAASFSLDIACSSNIFYRITCEVAPNESGLYAPEDIDVEVRSTPIGTKDSYESCIRRLAKAAYKKEGNYVSELEKVEKLFWLFEYPKDTGRVLHFPSDDAKFPYILETILKALDPSIQKVEKSRDVENAFVIRLRENSVIIQNGGSFSTSLLSSGTKAGVEIAKLVSALVQGRNSFYYCDEKFSYIHSDIEKALLSLMIDELKPNDQLFFTTHNTDILEMDLPKHAYTFFKRNLNDPCCPIVCVNASSFLKRSSDSLKKAVENDLFSIAPATDLIYDITNI